MTKEKIIEIFKKYIFNITNQAGDEYFVIEEDDFEKIAEKIMQEFEMDKKRLRKFIDDTRLVVTSGGWVDMMLRVIENITGLN